MCVCYLFVEGVCALQVCGAAGSLIQVVMTDQTHSVGITLQHKDLNLLLSSDCVKALNLSLTAACSCCVYLVFSFYTKYCTVVQI